MFVAPISRIQVRSGFAREFDGEARAEGLAFHPMRRREPAERLCGFEVGEKAGSEILWDFAIGFFGLLMRCVCAAGDADVFGRAGAPDVDAEAGGVGGAGIYDRCDIELHSWQGLRNRRHDTCNRNYERNVSHSRLVNNSLSK